MSQENQKLIDYYENALAKTEKRLLSQGSSSIQTSRSDIVTRLRQQLDSLRYKKVLMQAQGYAENSWQMGEINRDIGDFSETFLIGTFEEAVLIAYQKSRIADTVLLSPGASSFDMFDSYVERGNYFKEIVNKFK